MPQPGSLYYTPDQAEAFGGNVPPFEAMNPNVSDRFYYNPYSDAMGSPGGPSDYGRQTPMTGSPGGPNDYFPTGQQTQQPIPAAQQLIFGPNMSNAPPVNVAPPAIGNFPGRPMRGNPDLSDAPPVDVMPPQTPSGQSFSPFPGENWIGGGPAFTDPNTDQVVWNPLGTFNYNSGARPDNLPSYVNPVSFAEGGYENIGLLAGSQFGASIASGFSGWGPSAGALITGVKPPAQPR
jgi:hypothetical protein